MKRIVVNEHGGPETLTLVDEPVPEPGPREALVAISVSGVNFIDVYFRTGLYPSDRPTAIGSEAAGTVERVGSEVTEVKPGDRVVYAMARGSYAGVRRRARGAALRRSRMMCRSRSRQR